MAATFATLAAAVAKTATAYARLTRANHAVAHMAAARSAVNVVNTASTTAGCGPVFAASIRQQMILRIHAVPGKIRFVLAAGRHKSHGCQQREWNLS